MFQCAIFSVIAFKQWKGSPARWLAGAVVALCTLGILFTVTRAAWVGAIVGVVVTMLAFRELRPYLVPVTIGAALSILLALAVVPGLNRKVTSRLGSQRPLYVRQNLNTAALNMVQARPLFGFGWGKFKDYSHQYFRLNRNYPLDGTKETGVHNVPLNNAAELGLVGTVLWLLGIGLALGGAILLRGPPELRPWRMATCAITINWVIVANVGPAQYRFTNLVMFVAAGAASGSRLRGQPRPALLRLARPTLGLGPVSPEDAAEPVGAG
jgi:O-antigen ligase